MTNSGNADEWPSEPNTIAPAAHLQALGQITPVFNYLEESIGVVFKETMPTSSSFQKGLIPTGSDVNGPIEDLIVLPEKPPKPRTLVPYQPSLALKDAEFPAQSSEQ
jgi:hypothetical protein